MSEKQITDFFVRYGTALGSGDLAAVAACYATPSLVVSEEHNMAIANHAEVEAAFNGAADAYAARGLVDARPNITEVQRFTDALVLVAVTWDYVDLQGGVQPGESYRYLVRLGDKPAICVVIPVQAQ